MKALSTKKLALAGMLCALAVVGSVFSFPIFGSKCAPVQHMVNILCAVLLGPYYGIGVAFVASLLRNLLGLGSLMAFPGSMFGALLCGIVYHKTEKLLPTLVGVRHLHPGRAVRLPGGHPADGQERGRYRILCLHRALPRLDRRRCGHCRCAAGRIAALRRAALHADQPELRRAP